MHVGVRNKQVVTINTLGVGKNVPVVDLKKKTDCC